MNNRIEISDQEKREMYRLIGKEELINMLIEANRIINALTTNNTNVI